MGGFANSQQAYTENTGLNTTNSAWVDQRDPTQFDVNYGIGQFWQNQKDVKLWYLNRKSNFSGQLLATWELISVNSALVSLSDTANTVVFTSSPFATPPHNIKLVGGVGISIVSNPGSNLITFTNTGAGAETLTGDDGVPVPPIAGTIQTLGNVVANATHAKALYVTAGGGNIEQWDIQLSAAIAATDVTKVGLAAFDSAFFTVDANGFVSANGEALVEKVNLQTGTTPITPLAGAITFNGATVLAGTHPVRTDGTGAHTMALEVQISQALAATDATKIGLSNFSSAQFAVDANGFVTLSGGSGPPTLGLTPDTTSGGGTSPVVPNGSGDIIVTNAANFATGTQANSLRTISTAANTLAIQAQLAGGNATVSTANNFGVAQFDTNSFGVSSGFVTLKNGGTTGAVTNLIGDDTLSVVPAAGTGAITLLGATVANATHAKPVFFVKNAANTEELDVQLTTTSTSGAKNINKSGLAHFDSAFFTVDAATGFISFAGTGAGETITGSSGGAVSPTAGNWNLLGGTVAAGTTPVAVAGNPGTSTLTVNLQISQALAATDATKIGLSNFSNAQFAVDANGFVTLKGGTTPGILGMVPDAHTAPGTTPVVPNGSGNIILEGGATFATGTQANPIRTNSLAANTIDLQVQLAGSNAAASTANNFGVSQFDSNMFTVTSGFVQLKGGGVNPALTSIVMDAGTSPIVPNASGQMTFTGAQVATGVVGANVIRTDGTGVNTMAIQIQRTTTSGVSNVDLNGVCHFSSTNFTVDANGFVQFVGGSTAFPWTDEAAPFNAASNNGYYCTAVLTATLPPTPAQGDVVKFVSTGANVITLQANTGQKIRLGNVISGLAGTCASTRIGDGMELIYRSADGTWYNNTAPVGTWNVV